MADSAGSISIEVQMDFDAGDFEQRVKQVIENLQTDIIETEVNIRTEEADEKIKALQETCETLKAQLDTLTTNLTSQLDSLGNAISQIKSGAETLHNALNNLDDPNVIKGFKKIDSSLKKTDKTMDNMAAELKAVTESTEGIEKATAASMQQAEADRKAAAAKGVKTKSTQADTAATKEHTEAAKQDAAATEKDAKAIKNWAKELLNAQPSEGGKGEATKTLREAFGALTEAQKGGVQDWSAEGARLGYTYTQALIDAIKKEASSKNISRYLLNSLQIPEGTDFLAYLDQAGNAISKQMEYYSGIVNQYSTLVERAQTALGTETLPDNITAQIEKTVHLWDELQSRQRQGFDIKQYQSDYTGALSELNKMVDAEKQLREAEVQQAKEGAAAQNTLQAGVRTTTLAYENLEAVLKSIQNTSIRGILDQDYNYGKGTEAGLQIQGAYSSYQNQLRQQDVSDFSVAGAKAGYAFVESVITAINNGMNKTTLNQFVPDAWKVPSNVSAQKYLQKEGNPYTAAFTKYAEIFRDYDDLTRQIEGQLGGNKVTHELDQQIQKITELRAMERATREGQEVGYRPDDLTDAYRVLQTMVAQTNQEFAKTGPVAREAGSAGAAAGKETAEGQKEAGAAVEETNEKLETQAEIINKMPIYNPAQETLNQNWEANNISEAVKRLEQAQRSFQASGKYDQDAPTEAGAKAGYEYAQAYLAAIQAGVSEADLQKYSIKDITAGIDKNGIQQSDSALMQLKNHTESVLQDFSSLYNKVGELYQGAQPSKEVLQQMEYVAQDMAYNRNHAAEFDKSEIEENNKMLDSAIQEMMELAQAETKVGEAAPEIGKAGKEAEGTGQKTAEATGRTQENAEANHQAAEAAHEAAEGNKQVGETAEQAASNVEKVGTAATQASQATQQMGKSTSGISARSIDNLATKIEGMTDQLGTLVNQMGTLNTKLGDLDVEGINIATEAFEKLASAEQVTGEVGTAVAQQVEDTVQKTTLTAEEATAQLQEWAKGVLGKEYGGKGVDLEKQFMEANVNLRKTSGLKRIADQAWLPRIEFDTASIEALYDYLNAYKSILELNKQSSNKINIIPDFKNMKEFDTESNTKGKLLNRSQALQTVNNMLEKIRTTLTSISNGEDVEDHIGLLKNVEIDAGKVDQQLDTVETKLEEVSQKSQESNTDIIPDEKVQEDIQQIEIVKSELQEVGSEFQGLDVEIISSEKIQQSEEQLQDLNNEIQNVKSESQGFGINIMTDQDVANLQTVIGCYQQLEQIVPEYFSLQARNMVDADSMTDEEYESLVRLNQIWQENISKIEQLHQGYAEETEAELRFIGVCQEEYDVQQTVNERRQQQLELQAEGIRQSEEQAQVDEEAAAKAQKAAEQRANAEKQASETSIEARKKEANENAAAAEQERQAEAKLLEDRKKAIAALTNTEPEYRNLQATQGSRLLNANEQIDLINLEKIRQEAWDVINATNELGAKTAQEELAYVDACNKMTDASRALVQQEIVQAEQERFLNEQGRVNAELTRQAAEEKARLAEAERQAAEAEKQADEAAAQAEKDRQEALEHTQAITEDLVKSEQERFAYEKERIDMQDAQEAAAAAEKEAQAAAAHLAIVEKQIQAYTTLAATERQYRTLSAQASDNNLNTKEAEQLITVTRQRKAANRVLKETGEITEEAKQAQADYLSVCDLLNQSDQMIAAQNQRNADAANKAAEAARKNAEAAKKDADEQAKRAQQIKDVNAALKDLTSSEHPYSKMSQKQANGELETDDDFYKYGSMTAQRNADYKVVMDYLKKGNQLVGESLTLYDKWQKEQELVAESAKKAAKASEEAAKAATDSKNTKDQEKADKATEKALQRRIDNESKYQKLINKQNNQKGYLNATDTETLRKLTAQREVDNATIEKATKLTDELKAKKAELAQVEQDVAKSIEAENQKRANDQAEKEAAKTSELAKQYQVLISQSGAYLDLRDKMDSGTELNNKETARLESLAQQLKVARDYIQQCEQATDADKVATDADVAAKEKWERVLAGLVDREAQHAARLKETNDTILGTVGSIEEAQRLINEAYGAGTNQQGLTWTNHGLDAKGTAQFDKEIQNVSYHITEIEKGTYRVTSAINSSKAATSTWDKLVGTIGKRFQTLAAYLASFASVYRIWGAIKEGISTVNELNTQLTEMRKVTDESTAALKRYQDQTFAVAKEVGTTAAQIQSSTADYLRLGKDLDEAAELAKNTSILMSVSEFDSISDATEAMISMTQAFKEMSSMEIIDELNKIGEFNAETYSNIRQCNIINCNCRSELYRSISYG